MPRPDVIHALCQVATVYHHINIVMLKLSEGVVNILNVRILTPNMGIS